MWDAAHPGFGIRVWPSGRKTWAIRYHVGRRVRRLTLGPYTTLSLADARELAREKQRVVLRGGDPAEEKVQRRKAKTVGELAELYIAKHAKPKKRSWKQDDWLLSAEVLPKWKHRAASGITRADVRERVTDVFDDGRAILANRLRALLHKMFSFAVAHDIVEVNPVTNTERPGAEQQRDRVLSSDEIRTLWAALEKQPLEMRAVFQLRLLTAQRGGEVVNMRWSDLDLDGAMWTIPAEHAKNKLAHRVPLSTAALKILEDIKATVEAERLAREVRTGKPAPKPVFVLEGARGARQRREAASTFDLTDFRGHDLRRTAASMMTSAGVSRLVVSKVLNHVERGVTAVYDRHSYDAEKRDALNVLAREVDTILNPPKDGKVLPFAGR